MRFNVLVLVPTVVALASYVQGHYDEFDARDTREIQSLLSRSEIMEELAEISTRDLIDELSSRLEARDERKGGLVLIKTRPPLAERGGSGRSKPMWHCPICNKAKRNAVEADNCRH
ncbi:hypothetical protein D9611_011473 [Ephemerocybe angulata]|uniref:Uncharacterized protein n=1 Tax=Ephemerocybe angulata TaxID=980116 RepID=A0A8H5FJL3_9AGAR|nr:hypothetical protein D9611_011473 [Tulosesus angulatus]